MEKLEKNNHIKLVSAINIDVEIEGNQINFNVHNEKGDSVEMGIFLRYLSKEIFTLILKNVDTHAIWEAAKDVAEILSSDDDFSEEFSL